MLTGGNAFVVLMGEIPLRTGFLQGGQRLNGGRFADRRNSNRPPQTRQLPSVISYS